MKKTLSVAIATFNEEKNLTDCLKSVQDFADEIVIVDGNSSDSTVEIAKMFDAKIKETTNKQNFHINKQMAIDMCSKDWILQLDADERVSDELGKEIVSVLKTEKMKQGYWLPRKNYFLGRFLLKGGQYPDYSMRFYENGKGRLPQKDVHEQAVVSGEVGYLKNPLLHYPYRNFKSYLQKWSRYNSFFATQIRDQLEKRNFILKVLYAINYLVLKPTLWFLVSYIRHKGFMDGVQGLIFSFFSAIRFPVSFIKYIFI